jgi:hypothetical protein
VSLPNLTSDQLAAFARLGAHARLAELVAEMDAILTAFPDLGSAPARETSEGVEAPARGKRRKRPRMSAAARKAVSARMKKYWAERRKAR